MTTLFIMISVNVLLCPLMNIIIDRLPMLILKNSHQLFIDILKPNQTILTKQMPTLKNIPNFLTNNTLRYVHSDRRETSNLHILTFLFSTLTPLLWFILFKKPAIICAYMIFFNGLWVISHIDSKHFIIPDCINYFLLWLGILLQSQMHPDHLNWIIIGIITTYLTTQVIHTLYFFIRKTVGIGGGDIKMLSMLAAWIGHHAIALVVFLSCLSAIFTMLFKCVARKNHDRHIAFGPHLAMASTLIIISSHFMHSPLIKSMLEFSI